jgi:NADPH2:quinone reductase
VSYEEIGELDDIDVAIDPVGGPVFTACVKALRPLGVAIAIGFAGGTWEPADPARLVGRNVGVQGFYLGRLMGLRPDLVRAEAEELLALWRRGALHPVVGAEYPLEQANDALDLIASRRSTGKVVLVP